MRRDTSLDLAGADCASSVTGESGVEAGVKLDPVGGGVLLDDLSGPDGSLDLGGRDKTSAFGVTVGAIEDPASDFLFLAFDQPSP